MGSGTIQPQATYAGAGSWQGGGTVGDQGSIVQRKESKTMPMSQPKIVTIEWHMLDKRKFFPLSMASSFCVRCCLYPLNVVKTKLQIQKNRSLYSGTFDALSKIAMQEGIGGLYRGFWVSTFQLFSGVAYLGSYEGVREALLQRGVTDGRVRALCGGAAASLVAQTIIVPVDVISQHMMVIGQQHGGSPLNPLNIDYQGASKREVASRLVLAVYHKSGLLGFYRGYTASLLAYVPNSALWWTLYHTYQEELSPLLPAQCPALVTQCLAASMGGASTAVISNPLDILRARLQVSGDGTGIVATTRQLWGEEGARMLTKGLSARLIQSVVFSSTIILGYETVKRLSVLEEYKDIVRW